LVKPVALVLSVLSVAACGGADVIAPEQRYGVYALEFRQGRTVPAGADIAINGGLDTITNIASGLLDLRPDNTYSMSLMVHIDLNVQPEPFPLGSGAATYSGNNVSLALPQGQTVRARFGGSVSRPTVTVPIDEPLGTLVFLRFLATP
jgi:hypothetical protein